MKERPKTKESYYETEAQITAESEENTRQKPHP